VVNGCNKEHIQSKRHLGAVGVSGAPGGEKDEACALAGIKAVQEWLDFAM
jgi:uncharacterized protein GlcG (DUF336 family)